MSSFDVRVLDRDFPRTRALPVHGARRNLVGDGLAAPVRELRA